MRGWYSSHSLDLAKCYRIIHDVPPPLVVSVDWVQKYFPLVIDWLARTAQAKVTDGVVYESEIKMIQDKVRKVVTFFLFYSILFYSILFYSILFYSVLFCSVTR